MIRNLHELNRVLIGVNEISTCDGALIKNVIKHCSSIVLGGVIANHQNTIDFCIRVGLLRWKKDRLFTTDLADEFLYHNKENNYSLSDKQKILLARRCLLSGGLSVKIKEILSQFKPVHHKKTFEWSKSNGIRLAGNASLLNLMYQSEILFRSDDTILVNPQYASLVSSFRASAGQMTNEELREKFAEGAGVGGIAVDIVVDYEKKRLLSAGFEAESEMVHSIADVDVGAGFDVISFDGGGELTPDRFIEVKGSRRPSVSFVWSRNEMKMAKELGVKYWIYFVGGIDLEKKSSQMEPVPIQDPANHILDSDGYEKDCMKLFVRRAIEKPN